MRKLILFLTACHFFGLLFLAHLNDTRETCKSSFVTNQINWIVQPQPTSKDLDKSGHMS